MTRIKRPLFGGAIQAFLPDGAIDASSIRLVPNNQEVFMHAESDQSIIVEILERVDEVSDENSIKYHFDALAEANDAKSVQDHIVDRIEPIPINTLIVQRLTSAWYLFGRQQVSKYHEQAKNLVHIHVCLLRLGGDLATDILISFNDPVFINQQSSSNDQQNQNASRWTLQDFEQFFRSLEIIDYGILCYKHSACTTKESCIIDANKYQCSNSETFCVKNNIFFDVSERGCGDSFTCNASITIPGRYCCNTDYCNHAISSIQINRSILFISTLISFFLHYLQGRFYSMRHKHSSSSEKIVSMSFEQLPDEVLLIICSYLSPFHIIKTFNDLNYRLNCTISQYRQNIDLRCLNLRQFYFFCKMIRFSFGNNVRSIILSNAAPAVRQLILFRKQIEPFTHILPNLERLTLMDHYDDELDLYLPLISILKNLKELKINFIKNKNETILCTFITQMLTDNFIYFDHIPKRRKRDALALEKLSLTGTGYLKLTPVYNETITHLTIEIENTDDLLIIFTGFDCLQYLNVYLKQLTALSTNLCNVLSNQRKIQCLSLIDFRFQARWHPELLSFNQFISILHNIPNIQNFSCTLKFETNQKELANSDYINIEKWRNLCIEFYNLINLDCSIKSIINSSNGTETDFVRIIANISRTSDRSINIHLYYNNENPNHMKNDSTLELDIQELRNMTGSQLASKLKYSQEITLYNDLFIDDDKIFSTFPESLCFPDHNIFSHIRSLDLLGEFLNMNNIFLITFVEQLIRRSPNLQSIGFFLYWVENMTDLVLDFLRPLKKYLKQIKKCYLYTEGDIDEKFISELAHLFPSLTLLSIKVDWYCNTTEVVNLCLVYMKHLNHLEMVLEDIPDYLDEDYIDRIKMEKEIESLAMTRDIQEWLKRNTLLGKISSNKVFRAEKTGNDLKIWL
ncbi:unnamed protein product [Rotaria sp. Silwood1]|nr:unnamed protein product [Rotaria sp. Silwood1]CAF1126636.1 unnamed protein product [Rotaria sp. Silwood1]CAF3533297.1 unnamed protein product [Rotaria sp. Silwood1]CAF4663374.1 unnamed protein product [Rotaria sp. Silwood1]